MTEDPNKILIDDNKEEEVDPFENLVTLVTSLVPLLSPSFSSLRHSHTRSLTR